ncbi:hypothetical protein OG828_29610 [Streptomyces sp. NBC_00457]|uniref:hypothetical protein n=1 Tax=Streptomyces sp. NBC_00457 TaxID=2975748 RepID=UPI002E21D91D
MTAARPTAPVPKTTTEPPGAGRRPFSTAPAPVWGGAERRTDAHTAIGPSYDISRPPLPVAGCETCRQLAERRAAARAAFDYSAVGDANVLMRSHHRLDHGT